MPIMRRNHDHALRLDSHQFIDFVNLVYHREVAARLRADPEAVLNQARHNLQRWLLAYQPGEPDARCLEEWRHLLETRTVSELIAIITEDSDEGQRLRSSTPFAGILSLEERKELRRRCEEMAIA
jgi:hypothetical protein